MKYQIDVVNPRTNEEQQISVDMSELELARAKRSKCWMSAIQNIARPFIPHGFLPMGNRVRALS